MDYIHGADVVRSLAAQPNTVGFLLPAMGKEELFPTVIHDGVLPRKTFSMGRPTTSGSIWRPGASGPDRRGDFVEIQAFAKLNLTLDVLGKRPDGYHDLRMVMQSITLCDTLTLAPNQGQGLRVSTDLHFLPTGEKNLAAMAARRFWEALGRPAEDLDICIQKRIPVCLSMAYGSTDAAAVLRALNQRAGSPLTPAELARVGEQVGSDVPYCVLGGTALAEGRGERLTRCPPCPAAGWWSASRSSPSPRRSSLPASTASACAAVPTQTACSPPWRKGTWGSRPADVQRI